MKRSASTVKIKTVGRPASFDREDLISQVTDLFWEHGYVNLSFNQIATATGLTRASLYNAFETKEALFKECMKFYNEISPTRLLNSLKPGDKIGPVLFEVLDMLSHRCAVDSKNRGCLASNVLSELVASDAEVSAAIVSAQKQKSKRMTKLIRQAIKQNELPKDTDAEATGHIILAFMFGLNARSKTGTSKSKLTKMSRIFLHRMGFER